MRICMFCQKNSPWHHLCIYFYPTADSIMRRAVSVTSPRSLPPCTVYISYWWWVWSFRHVFLSIIIIWGGGGGGGEEGVGCPRSLLPCTVYISYWWWVQTCLLVHHNYLGWGWGCWSGQGSGRRGSRVSMQPSTLHSVHQLLMVHSQVWDFRHVFLSIIIICGG